MAVILQISSGAQAGRKTYLRPGQMLNVGRTEWSEFNVPGDTEMADVHFALDCGHGVCRVRDLSGGRGTLVNGKPVVEADVLHGDQITAGGTVFLLKIEETGGAGPGNRGGADGGAAAPGKPAASGFAKITAVALASDVCVKIELDPAAKALLTPALNVRRFFELLVEQKLTTDAIKFLAQALPKPECVWWACACVRLAQGDALAARDSAALLAAERWCTVSTEENRVATLAPAEATNYDTAAGWAAGGAFWSGGSLLPAGMAVVPPKETLTAQAVAVALNLAAISTGRVKQPATIVAFLALGSDVADGKNRWPEAKAP